MKEKASLWRTITKERIARGGGHTAIERIVEEKIVRVSEWTEIGVMMQLIPTLD